LQLGYFSIERCDVHRVRFCFSWKKAFATSRRFFFREIAKPLCSNLKSSCSVPLSREKSRE